jgi:hypothetical protein
MKLHAIIGRQGMKPCTFAEDVELNFGLLQNVRNYVNLRTDLNYGYLWNTQNEMVYIF